MVTPYSALGTFPSSRMRRLRANDWSRRMTRETSLSPDNLIWPLFVHEKTEAEEPILSMPGVSRYSVDAVVEKARSAREAGIPAIALFPAVDSKKKNLKGSEALNSDNIVCRAIHAVKESVPGIGIICDVALDPFTSHGHDGLVREKDGVIENDETVRVLCDQAVIQARAGCDVIAPSDMMDGRVGAVRAALDSNGFEHVLILSYAAKYASAFYGPFRDAVGSSSLTGRDKELGFRDKRSYQMDAANSDEALREVALDIQEGADMVMVKPGLPYLDVLYRVKATFGVPTFAYQVSGEYSMLVGACERNWLDRKRVMFESLLSFRRAGADGILTYFALEAAQAM